MEQIPNQKLNIHIENPKGSYKSFVEPGEESDYPLKGVTYPVDYGYLEGYRGEDDAELDIFVGTGKLLGYIRVWRLDVPVETKFFTQLTEQEMEEVITAFKLVLLDSKILNQEEFDRELDKFKNK